jgi:hypothetical protein
MKSSVNVNIFSFTSVSFVLIILTNKIKHNQKTYLFFYCRSSLFTTEGLACNVVFLPCISLVNCRSQWPRGLRRRSSAARVLRSGFESHGGAWMFVCCECCVLSGKSLCDGLITRPEESYRLWRVVVCNQETSKMRRLKPATGLWKIQPQWVVTSGKQRNKHFLSQL